MSSIVAAMPVYLGTGSDRCFALFHAADSSAARSAVLLCPPFGWEEICSYRSRRDWAGELALAGHPTLRFDLPGSGDSPGGPRDPGRLSAWTQALLDGGEWLRATSGAERLTAIGIGLGGLLAAHAALEGAEIDELVLWAVPARGRSLVRELRAFSRLEAANVVAPTDPRQSAAGADGELVANGYLLSGETVAALERLDLGEPPTRTIATRRVLLLGRDGLKADERLRAAFEQAGASVTSADGPGTPARRPGSSPPSAAGSSSGRASARRRPSPPPAMAYQPRARRPRGRRGHPPRRECSSSSMPGGG
jgi:pimeloyl-ACP methyl ester carboxylesterase